MGLGLGFDSGLLKKAEVGVAEGERKGLGRAEVVVKRDSLWSIFCFALEGRRCG